MKDPKKPKGKTGSRLIAAIMLVAVLTGVLFSFGGCSSCCSPEYTPEERAKIHADYEKGKENWNRFVSALKP